MSATRSHAVLWAVLSLLTMAVPAHANAIDQLRGFLSQTQSARGEFTQRVSAKGSATPATSSGTFVFQRPGKFRWLYNKPYQQTIVGDGQRLFLFDHDLNQVTVKKLTAALPASPASILFGSNQFERDFEVSDGGVRDGLQWVIARPRSKDTTFERIEIGFRDNLPAAMLLRDAFGQSTTLQFARMERNPTIESGAFEFVPPKGADVLEDK